MSASGGEVSGSQRLAYWIVRVAGWLVPSSRREDWLGEWHGELWARGAEGRRVVTPALGALSHAMWLRWDDWGMRVLSLGRDLRYGVRSARRRPLFAVSAVATLALGLGATTAVFSIVDAVLLAPLPYPGSDRFVGIQARILEWDMDMTGLSTEVFTEWRDRARGFDVIEGYETIDAQLVGAGSPVVTKQARVSGGFLAELLGIEPRLGRFFDAAEAAGEGSPVAVISEAMWRERFAGRPDVAGELVRINGRETEVIGVAPTVDLLPDVSIWTPLSLRADHSRLVLGAVRTIGRTMPGVDAVGALRSLEAAHAEAAEIHPGSMSPFEPVVVDFRSTLVTDVRTHLLLLLGAVGVVLILACVNVANLFLARGAERSHELAVRTSLGAGRRHLISQVVAESLVLTGAGGIAGIVLAAVSARAMLALVPAEIPLATAIGLDARVLGFAAAATIGTALLVATLPALRASRGRAVVTGRARNTQTREQRRAGSLLLGIEVAQAAALLVAAGLMINTMVRMTTARTGFEPEGLLFVHLDLPSWSFATQDNPTRRAAFMDDVTVRVSDVPGVRSIGMGSATPFSGMTFMTGVELEGGIRPGSGNGGLAVRDDGGDLVWFSRMHVDPGYLATLGLPLVGGRRLGPVDSDAAQSVGLINETAANAYWPGESPLGKRIRESRGGAAGAAGADDDGWITIVGVVADFGHPGLPTQGMAELYLPMSRRVLPTLSRPTLLIRHDGSGAAAIEGVRRAIWEVDPELPIPAIATASQHLGASLAVPRFYAILLGSFAGLALLLAAVGIYGVVAHSVARRTREIGIRMALGARSATVGAMVARDGVLAVAAGLSIGIAGGVVASRLLVGLLYGVEPLDSLTCAAVAVALALVAGAAIAVPARRAMAADPVASMRAD